MTGAGYALSTRRDASANAAQMPHRRSVREPYAGYDGCAHPPCPFGYAAGKGNVVSAMGSHAAKGIDAASKNV